MKTYKMTTTETRNWNSGTATLRDATRHDVTAKAAMRTPPSCLCEILDANGVVVDVVPGA